MNKLDKPLGYFQMSNEKKCNTTANNKIEHRF